MLMVAPPHSLIVSLPLSASPLGESRQWPSMRVPLSSISSSSAMLRSRILLRSLHKWVRSSSTKWSTSRKNGSAHLFSTWMSVVRQSSSRTISLAATVAHPLLSQTGWLREIPRTTRTRTLAPRRRPDQVKMTLPPTPRTDRLTLARKKVDSMSMVSLMSKIATTTLDLIQFPSLMLTLPLKMKSSSMSPTTLST